MFLQHKVKKEVNVTVELLDNFSFKPTHIATQAYEVEISNGETIFCFAYYEMEIVRDAVHFITGWYPFTEPFYREPKTNKRTDSIKIEDNYLHYFKYLKVQPIDTQEIIVEI